MDNWKFHEYALGEFKVFALQMLVLLVGYIVMEIEERLPAERFDGNCQAPRAESVFESEYIRMTEMFLCQGLDRSGNPRKPMDFGKSTDWEKIQVCAYVRTSGLSSLSAHWYFENGIEFTGRGVLEQVSDNGYVAFSLEEAVACSDNSVFHNYLADEIKLGYIPVGQYHVDIYQGIDKIGSLTFSIDD
jgi:hypothetical protein